MEEITRPTKERKERKKNNFLTDRFCFFLEHRTVACFQFFLSHGTIVVGKQYEGRALSLSPCHAIYTDGFVH